MQPHDPAAYAHARAKVGLNGTSIISYGRGPAKFKDQPRGI